MFGACHRWLSRACAGRAPGEAEGVAEAEVAELEPPAGNQETALVAPDEQPNRH